MIVEIECPDGRNEHEWDFRRELVEQNPRAGTCEEFLNTNIEVSDSNIFNVCRRI
jgi:hypothetical protein